MTFTFTVIMTKTRIMSTMSSPSLSRLHGTMLALLASLFLFGCAVVKPFEREKLADPIMAPGSEFAKQSLEQKFFLTREGSIGGPSGIGGGCGCSK